jgi:hypothetical protein
MRRVEETFEVVSVTPVPRREQRDVASVVLEDEGGNQVTILGKDFLDVRLLHLKVGSKVILALET